MHIAHCLTHSTLGGGQAVPYLLVKNFRDYHKEVKHTILLPSEGIYVDRFKDLGVQVIEFPFNTRNPFNHFRINSILQMLKPDIIHTHGRGAGLYIRSISKKRLAIKRVHTHHGFHLPESSSRKIIFKYLEDLLLTATDGIISVSASESKVIADTNKKSSEKITILKNIVLREDVIAASKETVGEYNSIFSMMRDKFVVLMIGRDDSVKNYSLAFSVAKSVLSVNSTIIFVFVGIENQTESLRALKKDYPENITVIASVPNPIPFLAKSSILMITSKREAGTPLVMMEGQCLGVPVIGVSVRGLYDSIENEMNGLCVENNVHSVTSAILRCSRDPALMKRLSIGAIDTAKTFNPKKWCQQYHSLYNELLRC